MYIERKRAVFTKRDESGCVCECITRMYDNDLFADVVNINGDDRFTDIVISFSMMHCSIFTYHCNRLR